MENKFNNFSLSDEEAIAVIRKFEKFIKEKSVIMGQYNEDCAQEIRIQIYKTLTQNNKK